MPNLTVIPAKAGIHHNDKSLNLDGYSASAEYDGLRWLLASVAALVLTITAAQAVTLRTVIRDCGDDGKTYCPKSSYGKQMQQCLAQNFEKLSPACKVVITKLKNGDSVTLF